MHEQQSHEHKKLKIQAMRAVPQLLDVLKKDPRALEIFLDELSLRDQIQTKHMKFLSQEEDFLVRANQDHMPILEH